VIFRMQIVQAQCLPQILEAYLRGDGKALGVWCRCLLYACTVNVILILCRYLQRAHGENCGTGATGKDSSRYSGFGVVVPFVFLSHIFFYKVYLQTQTY
jgi:hypothetical protein